MANDYAKGFYTSRKWITCRIGYMLSKNYICEMCGGTAKICHHIEYITPGNIDDPNITLNWNNLMSVCQDCHNNIHHKSKGIASGLMFDEKGNLKKIKE